MNEDPIPRYEGRLTELSSELREMGTLGLVVIDASALESIEYEYGTGAYEEVRQRVFRLLVELKDKDFREADSLALCQPHGLCFVLSLGRKRRQGLALGVRGGGFETADRLCRSRALLNSGRLPSSSKLFVNTLPATIRDPEFRGQSLIDFMDRAQVAPGRLVIEITEKQVIENYGLFQEAMAYFTDLGMSFAVDDVGAGYSGLEAIARLSPAYLKIDMSLVRDVLVSLVNREMVKAIVSLGHGLGAAVVGEGIQTEDELRALGDMGVDFGQGFYLGRPDTGTE